MMWSSSGLDVSRGSARLYARAPAHLLTCSALAAAAANGQTAPPASTLPAVVVTATRFAENAAELPFGVSVLTAAQIEAAGVATVNEAIMKLLGVPGRLDLYGGGNYALDLRGFGDTASSNQVVIVDGIRYNGADAAAPRLADIPIDMVARIEVMRGNGSVLYGEGATGGVIVITTKAAQGAARRNQADLYAAAGSFGLREARATATVAAGGFSLDAAASRRDADNDRDNFSSKLDAASVTAQWRTDGLRLGLRLGSDHLETGLPGSLSAAEFAENPRQTSHPNDYASIRGSHSSLFSKATLGDWQIGFDAGRRDKSVTSLNTSAGSVYAYDYEVGADSYSLRARQVLAFGPASNALTLGLDDNRWTRTVAGSFGSVATQRSHALYLKDEYAFAGGTRLSAGWRIERLTLDSSIASGLGDTPQAWELGLVQPLSPQTAVFGRVGKSFRLANVDELAPNARLKPQTSRDSELGVRWNRADGRIEFRFYRNELEHEIGYDPNAPGAYPGFFGANVNFDPTRREGAELELSQRLNAAWGVHLNAAMRRATFRAGPYAGKDVPLTPRRTLALRVDWQPAAGQRLDGGIRYVASQRPDFENRCTMPGYATADLRYALQWGAAEWALGISNLTDRKYYTLAYQCTNGIVEAIYPDPGRALTASVRLRF